MNELCSLIWCGLIGFFRSRTSLEAEILVLRHQLNVLRRKSPKRPTFGNIDRLIFAGLYSLAPAPSIMAPITAATAGKVCRSGFRDLGPDCEGVSMCSTGFYAGPNRAGRW
jgi:hypothetical protein